MVKVPPLGEYPKDKGGAASGEEAAEQSEAEGLHQWSADSATNQIRWFSWIEHTTKRMFSLQKNCEKT